ncbi:hypothetical protein CEXT_254141 [Caerostris extrusa]|uniref:Uncharacterized protein n=1 Tax=Caerostris extrusa TaxID=172846 RepID=A0AAV4TXQ7_CAEEX|nr:hypothetical protein CEXT_254141 [Caerostris extrusa]
MLDPCSPTRVQIRAQNCQASIKRHNVCCEQKESIGSSSSVCMPEIRQYSDVHPDGEDREIEDYPQVEAATFKSRKKGVQEKEVLMKCSICRVPEVVLSVWTHPNLLRMPPQAPPRQPFSQKCPQNVVATLAVVECLQRQPCPV